jgi:hypothetical protein
LLPPQLNPRLDRTGAPVQIMRLNVEKAARPPTFLDE